MSSSQERHGPHGPQVTLERPAVWSTVSPFSTICHIARCVRGA